MANRPLSFQTSPADLAMIECVFTLDYEIYGNGTGALNELVYEPTENLLRVFEKWDARFVNYVEVSEFEMIEAAGTDAAISLVKRQVKEMHRRGYEIALHLHPQWYNARFAQGQWELDYTEYNLCTLSQPRIAEIVDRSVNYLCNMVDDRKFSPISFRAGNWLFQPTQNAARELSRRGLRIDSSVFKGGLQRNHELDYRPAMKNGYYWPFSSDVNVPDAMGQWLELPIYAEMVRPWKMATSKRMGMGGNVKGSGGSFAKKVNRALDFLRLGYPLKFDFCRMTLAELTSMMDRVIALDRRDPDTRKPIVAIGHSKDLNDFQTVDAFLAFLREKKIPVVTFENLFANVPEFTHSN
jgi:hypothetical protein